MGKLLRHLIGWSSLVVGVAGLFLPILQGWLFISIGVVLLAPDVPLFRRLECWIERRFPAVRGAMRKLRVKLGRSPESPCDAADDSGAET